MPAQHMACIYQHLALGRTVVANELSYDGQTVLGTYKAVCLGVGGCMYLEVVELLIYLSTEASVDGYVEA